MILAIIMVKNIVMIKVNSAEAKAKLSEYLDRALAGERIVICRHNEPVVELRPIAAMQDGPRPVGPLPGRPTFEVSPSFFDPLPAGELEAWEGVASPAGSVSAGSAPRVAERGSEYGSGKSPRKRRS